MFYDVFKGKSPCFTMCLKANHHDFRGTPIFNASMDEKQKGHIPWVSPFKIAGTHHHM
jgi:hypothetical protein